MTHVLYLDRYHLGDPLFLTGFARDVLGLGAPCLLVHGAGEAAERALEAEGRVPVFENGVLHAETAADRHLVARAARDLNRRIVHTLNDAGVAAVGVEASGRGLIRAQQGKILAGNTGWLQDLVARGAVPVVAAILGDAEGSVIEANGGAVAGVLARALAGAGEAATVVFLTKNGQNGLYSNDLRVEEAALDVVSTAAVPEIEAVRAASETGAAVVVTSRSGLRATPLEGTRVRRSAPEETP